MHYIKPLLDQNRMIPALCTATISLSAFANNLKIAQSCAPNSKVMAVLKADAYGHGLTEAAKALSDADAFAVARIEEGIALRMQCAKPIIVLSGCSGKKVLELAAEHHLQAVIHTLEDWQVLQQHFPTLPYWLKVDTGMHRLGLSFADFQQINAENNTLCQGIISHLSDAEELQFSLSQLQLQRLQAFQAQRPELPCSLANSAALLYHPETHLQWVRPGLMLYGCNPAEQSCAASQKLQAVMSFCSQVIALHDIEAGERVGYNGRFVADKPTRIATIAVGYADGYPRHAKDGTPVWINGKVFPLAGKVSMDLITVNVSGGEVKIGDTVELWGKNLSASTVAAWADTISYHLFTGLTQRVPRVYHP